MLNEDWKTTAERLWRSFVDLRQVVEDTYVSDRIDTPRRLLWRVSPRRVEDLWRIFGRFDTPLGYAGKRRRPGKTMPDLGFLVVRRQCFEPRTR
jgi:hypothetical protein